MLDIYIVILLTLFAALLASLTQFFYKKGLPNEIARVRHVLPLLKNRSILCGIGLNLLAFAVYLYALANAPLSFVYPIFASTFIFTVLLSHFAFHEKIGIRRSFGVLLIFIGVAVISLTL
jgi:drug/metabolite transporter (DMT)-like permease